MNEVIGTHVYKSPTEALLTEIDRQAAAVERLKVENALLREEASRLTKMTMGEWFYPADGYDQECCFYAPEEVIDYLDLEPGDHVVEVNAATSLPSIWCAVRVTADEDADERATITEHASEDAARASLTETSNG